MSIKHKFWCVCVAMVWVYMFLACLRARARVCILIPFSLVLKTSPALCSQGWLRNYCVRLKWTPLSFITGVQAILSIDLLTELLPRSSRPSPYPGLGLRASCTRPPVLATQFCVLFLKSLAKNSTFCLFVCVHGACSSRLDFLMASDWTKQRDRMWQDKNSKIDKEQRISR